MLSEWKLDNLKEKFKGKEIIISKVILAFNRKIFVNLSRNMVMLNGLS